MSHSIHFGKFHHIGEFLNHYKKWNHNDTMAPIHQADAGNIPAQIQKIKNINYGNVELQATITQFFGDQHEHYQFYIEIDSVITPSDVQEIQNDITNCISTKQNVFLAVRYGDNEGLSQPIAQNLAPGVKLHLKGDWITEAKAYSHNGDKMPVLHFTHHPVGFICVIDTCYS